MVMHSYSQRQLNPYRGVVRVIRHGGAEAVTQDGWHWDIYVSNQALLDDMGEEANAHRHRVLVSDIRFGRWSPDQGLKRGPIYPSADFRRMEQEGAALYAYLREVHEAPVFPFTDLYELWLLDARLRPLALLASVASADEMDLDLRLDWRVGDAARAGFSCEGVVEAAEVLAARVRQLATAQPAAIWVRRVHGEGHDGDAWVMARIAADADKRKALENLPASMPTSVFPRYFLAETGHDIDYARLVRAYLDWQAPCLLLLPSLTQEERGRLETLARSQAAQVEKHHRLYPECVDAAQILAARVEAMLCRTQPARAEEYGFASIYYIELSDDGVG
jgi:hypothetical protein